MITNQSSRDESTPDGSSLGDDPLRRYEARAREFADAADGVRSAARRVATYRVLLFVGALIAFLVAERTDSKSLPLAVGLGLLVGFALLVGRHRRLRRELRRLEELRRYNSEGARRIARDWDVLPGSDVRGPGTEHANAFDLDLFGRASLFQLLGTVSTAPGRASLRDWLVAPAAPDEIRERQAAVAELAPMTDRREELAVLGRLDGTARIEDVDRFLEWAEDEPWLLERPALIWASRLIPATTLTLIALQLVGLVSSNVWVIPVVVGLILTRANSRRLNGAFNRAFARAGAFRQYSGLFRLLAELPAESARLRALREAMGSGSGSAHRRMHRLGRIGELSDLRFSTMAHFPLHALTLWDFHILLALERWQLTAGRRARGWIETLGELDALAALATLAHDNPDWCFPTIRTEGEPTLEASELAHPLLPDGVRVANDVRVGPPGSYLLVTGSNMSGKSTLLRAIGTNVVLAQAGGPVCARAMTLPPLLAFTSMRVSDSLERGVSYFMAELNRLKQVVDAADEAESGDRTLLFLLDEILHGTNTAERQVAAQRVIRHLVERGAIGAVSTHDLALADAPDLAQAVRTVHFSETVRRDENGRLTMDFDYELRPGVATSTNALALMEIVGLPLDDA